MRNMIGRSLFPLNAFAVAISILTCSSSAIAAFGDKLGPEFRVNTRTPGGQRAPALARSANGDFVVVFADSSLDQNVGVYFRRYSADGTAKDTPAVRVVKRTAPKAKREPPDVAANNDGNFAVTWLEPKTSEPAHDRDRIFVRRYSAAGTPGAIYQIDAVDADTQLDTPSIAMDAAGNIAVVYSDFLFDASKGSCMSSGVYIVRLFANGTTRMEKIAATAAEKGCAPVVAMKPDGDFIVAFQSTAFDIDGIPAYSNLRARTYSSVGAPRDILIEHRDYDLDLMERSKLSDIAVSPGGNFVATWTSWIPDSDPDINRATTMMRRYDSNGGPLDAAQRVNVDTTHHHRDSAVQMASDGSFTVAWERTTYPGDENGDVIRRSFGADGIPTSVDVIVNTYTTGFQDDPAIAVNADGSFVVAWESAGQDGSGDGVFAQRHEGMSCSTPTVQFGAAKSTVTEPARGAIAFNVLVRLSCPAASKVTVPITADPKGTATPRSDYRLPSSVVEIPAGQTSGNFVVTVLSDSVKEKKETIILTMGVPTTNNASLGTTRSHTLAIPAND